MQTEARLITRWQRSLCVMLLMVLAISLLPSSQVVAQPVPPPSAAMQAFLALQTRAGAPIDVKWNKQGKAEFVSAQHAAVLPLSDQSQTDPVARALSFLDENRTLFGIRDVATELRFLRSEPDTQLGWSHLRFDQVYQGLPVFGRQLVVHLNAQGQPVSVNGQFAPGLNIPVEAMIDAAQAQALAIEHLKNIELTIPERLTVEITPFEHRSELVVYIDQFDKARVAWSIKMLTTSPLGEWQYFINARRPSVIHLIDSLNSAKRRKTYTAGNTTRLPGRLLIDEGERARNDKAAQAAHDNAGVVYDYFFNNFQRNSIDGQGGTIVSTVHFGSSSEDAENAAWIGELQQMIYGDGGRIFQPLSLGLDVVAHELTHGITDNTAQLIYEGQSGALNESYSDVFAVLIDSNDWTLGEDVVKSPPYPTKVLRSVEDPNLGRNYDPNNPLASVGQPKHANEFANLPVSRRYDNGGVHVNSGIPNHAAYLIANQIGREKTGQIYYRTLTQYLTPSSDFYDAAELTLRAAQDLYGATEANVVRNAFIQIGIDPGGSDVIPEPEPDDSGLPNIPAQPEEPQPIPSGCTDLIVNGGFENNDSWVQVTAGEFELIDSELPYSGKRSAWLGGTDQETLQILYQDIRIPPNATSVELSYYRLVHQEIGSLFGIITPDAVFSTLLANTNGDILSTVEQISSSQGDDTWYQAKFNLARYAGKTVRLAFSAENTLGNVSSYFIDEVALIACSAQVGSGSNTPEPSSGNQVYLEGTITNVNTNRGIEGAQIFVIRQGLTATQAAADDNIAGDEVLTYGTTDAKGYYRTNEPIPRGVTYSVIVIASGYRPIIADNGVVVEANATSSLVVDAQMRR